MPDRIFLGHTTALVTASVTRATGTTTYTAGDVIGTAATHIMEFSDVARSAAGAGMIVIADLIGSANLTTKPDLELWLFSVAPAAQVDNVAFAPTDAEMAYLLGVIDLSVDDAKVGNAGSDAAGNIAIPSAVVGRPFQCAASVTDIFGCLVVRNAYVPVSAEIFTINLWVLQDY